MFDFHGFDELNEFHQVKAWRSTEIGDFRGEIEKIEAGYRNHIRWKCDVVTGARLPHEYWFAF